jgi:23S rRNA (uracil1939-C5)-methyltransferase
VEKEPEIIETEILDTADRAQTFARLEDGQPVFIQGPAAVGDTVRARIFKRKRGYATARLLEVLQPSDRRTEPVCADFGRCGGCKWQHLHYAEQLRIKTAMVQDALRHIGLFENAAVEPALPAPAVYGYRNKVDFSFSDMRWLDEPEMDALERRGINIRQMNTEEVRELPCAEFGIKPLHFALGFHAPGCFSKALDMDCCHLVSPEINTVLRTVRAFCLREDLSVYSTLTHTGLLRNLVVRQGGKTGELMVNLITSTHKPERMQRLLNELHAALGDRLTTFINGLSRKKNTVAFNEEEVVLHGEGFIRDTLGDYTYQISANSFFQTNTLQAEALYHQVLQLAELGGNETVYDLFCGTGSIALFASRHCARVLGMELVESSVNDARENAARHRVTNAEFLQLDLKDLHHVRPQMEAFGRPEVIITDPPRAGMHPKAVEMTLELAPEKIIYVSCNPASLARDGKAFAESGRYRLETVQPVDMFPQTNHIESVARFRRV